MRQAFLSLLLLAASSLLMARAEDLVTRDGTVYHDYKVLSHDAGYLTIMYSDGGGKIPLSNLPDDLQKEYGYNKQQADAAVAAAIAQDRQDRQAIANEEAQHQQQLAAQAQAQGQAPAADNVTPPQPAPVPIPGPAPAAVPNPPAVASATAPAAGLPAPFTSNPNAPLPLSEDEITEVENKIGDLTVELTHLNRQRNAGVVRNSAGLVYIPAGNSAFDEQAKDDQAQLKELNDSLIADSGLVGVSVPCLNEEEVDATYDQIGALKKERLTLVKQSAQAESTQAKLAQDQAEQTRLEARLESNWVHSHHVNLPQDQVGAIQAQIKDLETDMAKLQKEAGNNDGPYAQAAIDDQEQIAKLKEKIRASL